MKILVLNGPNLNMLGIREPGIYGSSTYDDLVSKIVSHCSEKGVDVVCSQSNHEGELIDMIQQAYFDKVDGIVINPAIPSEWKKFTITKNFRGKTLNIRVENPNGSEHGVKKVTVDGSPVDGILIPEKILRDKSEIVIEM